EAAKRNSSATGSMVAAVSRRITRMRSAVGVPPGSLVARAFGIRSASLRSCVDFPEPSMPSRVMNMLAQPIPQPHQVMLTHQLLEDIVPRQESKPFAEARAPM